MTVLSVEYYEGEPKPVNCSVCGAELEKWINIVMSDNFAGDLCPNCAQHLMRILFEDLIDYHNGKHVSLLNIMYHGEPKEDYKYLKTKLDKLKNQIDATKQNHTLFDLI